MSHIYEKEEIVLDRADTGNRETFRFRICEDLPSNKRDCRLVIQVIGLSESDELDIDINGEEISSEDISWDIVSDPPTCTISVSGPPFSSGDNQLGLMLSSCADDAGKITVEQIDCYLN